MDTDGILSISMASRGDRSAVAAPSPVLDLIYACYYLRGVGKPGKQPLEWARELLARTPELVSEAASLVEGGDRGNALFAMALELGYSRDDDPHRYLSDLTELPRLIRESFPRRAEEDDDRASSWLRDPPDAAWSTLAAEVLTALWGELGPMWERQGRPAAERAASEVNANLAEHGDVLRALPRRHFAQFENHAGSLREAHSNGTLRIVPLALAEGGGFHLKGDRVTAVGFGLHGERIFEATERKVSQAAEGAKALADPTRLMLLNLIIRFDSMSMTVGDLARQLGVTQPTVSGHLKQLRQAGLITTERKGNRTQPKANDSALEELLRVITEVVSR